MSSAEPKPKREPRKIQRIVLRDQSATPGVALMERLAMYRNPAPEDLAIVDCWAPSIPRGCIPSAA